MSAFIIFLAYISKLLLFFALPAGFLIWKVKQGKRVTFGKLFFLTLGLLVVMTTGYAILHTRLLTVQLVYVVILALSARKLVREWQETQEASTHRWTFLLGSLLAILHSFIWAFWGRIRSGEFPFVIPAGTERAGNDIHFYAFISHFLPETHQENYFHIYNILDPGFHGVKPYHYLELWLSAIISDLLGGLTVLNLSLVAYPLFYALIFIGLLAIWERFVQVKWYHILLTIAFFYAAGTFNEWYKDLKLHDFSLPIHSWRYKISVYYVFLLGSILALIQKKYLSSLVVLLCLPIATVVAAPVIFAFIPLWLLLPQKIHGLNWRKRAFILGLLGLIGLWLLVFYGNFGGQAASTLDADEQLLAPLKNLMVPKILWAKLKYTGVGFLEMLALYAPYLFIAGLFVGSMPREQRGLLGRLGIFLGLFILLGAGIWTVLFHLVDAAQLHFNTAIPLANITAFVLLILVFSSFDNRSYRNKSLHISKGILSAGMFCLLVFVSFQKVYKRHIQPRNTHAYSQEYLAEIQTYLDSGEASVIGGAIKGGKDYQSIYGRRPSTYTLGYYLAYMAEGSMCVSLSDFDIPVGKNKPHLIRKDIASGIFYQFVQRQKTEGTYVSIEHSQLAFIDLHTIRFVIVSKAASLPPAIQARVARKIIDKRSKEKFFILGDPSP
ncbi:MAG: hypothetical protein AAF587_41665 [Bacteroidota bacterium]